VIVVVISAITDAERGLSALSVRTVESHIYRAMVKTGTTSRDELDALLTRHRARTE
jgi:DNA-binding NarL/FixJ family response regulator